MRLIIALIAGLLAAAASAQPATPTIDHALDLYQDAVAAAEADPIVARARFADAATAFDAVEAEQPVNAEFYRAQGNAHFFAGDIGRAVLAYRRGLDLDPGDARLVDSLRVARQAVHTATETSASVRLPEMLTRWRRFVPPVVAVVLFAASWVGLWGLLIASRIGGTRVRPIVLAALGAASVVSGAALGADAWHRADRSSAVIIAETEAFNGPSRDIYEPTFPTPLSPGVEGRILDSRQGWSLIRLRSGSETWVPEDTIAPVSLER